MFGTMKGTLINPTNLRKRSFAPLLSGRASPTLRFTSYATPPQLSSC